MEINNDVVSKYESIVAHIDDLKKQIKNAEAFKADIKDEVYQALKQNPDLSERFEVRETTAVAINPDVKRDVFIEAIKTNAPSVYEVSAPPSFNITRFNKKVIADGGYESLNPVVRNMSHVVVNYEIVKKRSK